MNRSSLCWELSGVVDPRIGRQIPGGRNSAMAATLCTVRSPGQSVPVTVDTDGALRVHGLLESVK